MLLLLTSPVLSLVTVQNMKIFDSSLRGNSIVYLCLINLHFHASLQSIFFLHMMSGSINIETFLYYVTFSFGLIICGNGACQRPSTLFLTSRPCLFMISAHNFISIIYLAWDSVKYTYDST